MSSISKGAEKEENTAGTAPLKKDLYPHFRKPARDALTYASQEAQRMLQDYIGTEHLLLGLLHQRGTLAAKALEAMGVNLERARAGVNSCVAPGKKVVLGELGFSSRARRVMEHALDESRRLGQPFVATEHLLLGLLREPQGRGVQSLLSLGVDLLSVRTEIFHLMGIPVTVNDLPRASSGSPSSTSASTSATGQVLPAAHECPNCHKAVEVGWSFCTFCGARTRTVCARCQQLLPAVSGATFCPFCGARVVEEGGGE